ncbi:hypothetical protein ACQ4PT_053661 [Festuca glaucescens]
MAGQVSENDLGIVLLQAMLAAKNIRPQRDRLLHLRRRLEQLSLGEDHADRIKELGGDLFNVYFIGIEYGARVLATCLKLAVQRGARFAVNLAFTAMSDEQLHDALVAQRLPARPTTQAEAFSRVEMTLNAVKVIQDHHIPRCIEHLVGERPPTVFAIYSGQAKTDSSDKAPAAATAVDLDKARDYLDRAITLADLAVKHIDLAVVVISRFMDPKKVASHAEYTDKRAYISELARDLFDVYYIGIEYGARTLLTCLKLAAEGGARLAVNFAFAAMPEEQLHDALVAQRLPARPTTQTEAFSRIEVTLHAVKVLQDHHVPCCIEHLVGQRPPIVGERRKTDPSDKAQDAATAVDLDKARDYLDRAITLADLAVKHIDLAVAVISRFLDPKEVASLSHFTDETAYISEVPGTTYSLCYYYYICRVSIDLSIFAGSVS